MCSSVGHGIPSSPAPVVCHSRPGRRTELRSFRRACRFISKNQRDRLAKELRLTPTLKTFSVDDASLIRHASSENKNIVEFLCKNGVDPDVKDTTGGTVLIDASAVGNIDLLKTLVKCGANPSHQNDSGESGFSFACAFNQMESAKVLYAAGADINHSIGENGGKPMDWAMRFGSDEFIEWLKEIGCTATRHS